MKTLTIKDLARTEALDRSEMAAVRGGFSKLACLPQPCYPYPPCPTPDYGSSDSSVHAQQNLQQLQSVMNSTANGSAFLDNLHVTNNTSQFGQNNVNVYR
jgi:hypothetical protein